MKGKPYYFQDRNRWRVGWWDEKAHKWRLIDKYNGNYMPCTAFKMKNGQLLLDKNNRPIPDKNKCSGYNLALKLLSLIQGRWEQSKRGECVFRLEEFTKKGWSDTIEWYNKWITDAIAPYRKPATTKGYISYLKNWIEPFFSKCQIRLHEIEHDTLMNFLRFILEGLKKEQNENDPKTDLILKVHKKNPELKSPAVSKVIKQHYKQEISESWIRRVLAKNRNPGKEQKKGNKNIGKTALNIMSSLHSALDYAHRSNKISKVPPFPKRGDYQLKGKDIDYLSPKDFRSIFEKIPVEHHPIFKWIHLHFRRPGEACALHKIDYDPINGIFKVRRAISARKIVDSVKTNFSNPKIHYVDCDPDFIDTANALLNENSDSPFMFSNPRARKKHGRYTLESLRNIWYKACDDADVRRIWQYRGLKHTACMEFLENGGTGDELMMLTDHANRKSIDQYTEITVQRKRMARVAARKRKEAREKVLEEQAQANIQFQKSSNIILFKPRNQ